MFSCHDQSTANAAYRYPTYSFKLSSYVAHRRCNKNSCSSRCQHWSLDTWYKCSTCAVPSSGVKLLQAKVCPVRNPLGQLTAEDVIMSSEPFSVRLACTSRPLGLRHHIIWLSLIHCTTGVYTRHQCYVTNSNHQHRGCRPRRLRGFHHSHNSS